MKRVIRLISIVIATAIIFAITPVNVGAIVNDRYANNTYINNKTKSTLNETEPEEVDVWEDETTRPFATSEPTTTQPVEVTTAPVTTEPVTTEPLGTVITLPKSNRTVFIGESVQMGEKVQNGVGLVSYTSRDPKIATVDRNGKVTAVGIGKTTIVIENNGAKAVFTIKVKQPYLSRGGKEVQTITVNRNCNKAIRVKGTIKGIDNEYKTSSSVSVIAEKDDSVIRIRGNRVTAKGNYAVVKVLVNGYTLKLNVKVVAETDYQKYVTIKYRHKKPNITRIYKNTININGLYSARSNLTKICFKGKINWSQVDAYSKFLKPVAYSVSNKKILKLNKKDGTVKAVGEGTASVAFRFKDGTRYSTTIKVTKPRTKTVFKPYYDEYGQSLLKEKTKARVCYTNHEVYNAIIDALFNYIIKGEKPKYDHLYIAFDFDKLNVGKIIDEKYDDGYNLLAFCGGKLGLSMYTTEFRINNTVVVGQLDNSKEELKEFDNELKTFKKVYTAAQKILDAAMVSDKYNVYDNDVDKLISLTNYLYATRNLEDCTYNHYGPVYRFIVLRGGTCHEYCEGFMYLCSLLRIPCYDITGIRFVSHGWNVVKLNGKWYCYEPQDTIYMAFSGQYGEQTSLWGTKDWNTYYTVDDRNNSIVRHIYKILADYSIQFTKSQVTKTVNKSNQKVSGWIEHLPE